MINPANQKTLTTIIAAGPTQGPQVLVNADSVTPRGKVHIMQVLTSKFFCFFAAIELTIV